MSASGQRKLVGPWVADSQGLVLPDRPQHRALVVPLERGTVLGWGHNFAQRFAFLNIPHSDCWVESRWGKDKRGWWVPVDEIYFLGMSIQGSQGFCQIWFKLFRDLPELYCCIHGARSKERVIEGVELEIKNSACMSSDLGMSWGDFLLFAIFQNQNISPSSLGEESCVLCTPSDKRSVVSVVGRSDLLVFFSDGFTIQMLES